MSAVPITVTSSEATKLGDAEQRVKRPDRAAPSEAARVTRAEINLAYVRRNLQELHAYLDRTSTPERARPQIWAVLKADGYGHGAAAIATTLEHAGVDGLCVALLEEGIELRNAGVRRPILVMGGYYGRFRDGIEALLDHQLTPVVYQPSQVEALASVMRYRADRRASSPRERCAVHLKIDTGMGRLGVRDAELPAMLTALRNAPELELTGVMTHLACADMADLAPTREQLQQFDTATEAVRRAGFNVTIRHAANSAAMLRVPEAHLEVVRPGIAIFGVHPCPGNPSYGAEGPKLKPVMRVLSEVVALRDLGPGEAVGYGHTWRAKRPSRIATLPMGYADGLSRALANDGEVLICGRRAPIVGAISMDLTMVDVTGIPGVSVRDEIVVLGHQRGRLGEDVITVEELVTKTNSITWDFLTSISRRVPRFYRHP